MSTEQLPATIIPTLTNLITQIFYHKYLGIMIWCILLCCATRMDLGRQRNEKYLYLKV